MLVAAVVYAAMTVVTFADFYFLLLLYSSEDIYRDQQKMNKKSNNKYQCLYCAQTSSRKYNIKVHTERKHPEYFTSQFHHTPSSRSKSNQFPVANESSNLIDLVGPSSSSPLIWERSMNLPISSAFNSFPDRSAFNFHHDPIFYYIKVKEEEEKRKKRELERSFNRTLFKFLQMMIVVASLKLQNTPFNYVRRISNTLSTPCILLDQRNIPIAYKIYKCQNCLEPIFESFFDFQEIHSSNKFIHNCYSNRLQQKNQNNDINNHIETLNLQELLLSIINIRLKSEDKLLLKMIVFSDDLIENALPLKILIDLMDNIGSKKDPFRWLFELVEKEGFIDLGEISSDHWIKRAYDCSSTEEKVTKLEKEELKQFLRITEGTFGLIKFRIDKKTIYTFCYLPFDNTKTTRQDGEDKGVISSHRFSEVAKQAVEVATENEEKEKEEN